MGGGPLRQGARQCGARCDGEDRRGCSRASAPVHRRAERRREADSREAGGQRRPVDSTIGDPQWSETAPMLPVRGWRGNRAKSVASDPRLCRDHAHPGRLVRAAPRLPAFPHGSYHRDRDARRKHRPAPRRVTPALAALARGHWPRSSLRVRRGTLPLVSLSVRLTAPHAEHMHGSDVAVGRLVDGALNRPYELRLEKGQRLVSTIWSVRGVVRININMHPLVPSSLCKSIVIFTYSFLPVFLLTSHAPL